MAADVVTPVTAIAPAKINLFLHVGPVDGEGYHPLTSLVAFADVGDGISVAPADRLSLTVGGPFGSALTVDPDNLILRALRALGEATGTGEPPVQVHLDKRLPIAAGLGGGSSDAGAALKLARDLLGLDIDDAALGDIAKVVGADGPMCLHARSAWAEGRGEVLTFEPKLPPLPALLVNPGVPSPTGAVYRTYDAAPRPLESRPAPPGDWSATGVIDWLAEQRNDLEAPAITLQPVIGAALQAVAALPEARLTRMSGSGATVFALFDTREAAEAAARQLASEQPDWWIMPTTLAVP
ncbi:4-(cytidine 5'-diphospho)-2-C-methyl-D-erythritol kinase [Brevundimonas sp.]|uniref:4-(cytidine 5'-diphospho)-2-C-methyl-D-erythritol kinase n=1 Tax=Brevundimonas sp. TaxID=1871086 RepID=UPI0035B090ED